MLDKIKEFLSTMEQVGPATRDVEATMENAKQTFTNFAAGLTEGAQVASAAYTEMAEGIRAKDPTENLSRSMNMIKKDMDMMASALGNITALGDIVTAPIAAFGSLAEGIAVVNKETMPFIGALDQSSMEVRRLERNFGQLGQTMGMSFEETKEFSEEFMKLMAYEGTEFFITPTEIENATKALAKQSFAFKDLVEDIEIAGKSMLKQEAIMMLSKATGEDLSSVADFMSDSVLKSGMSFETAASQYGVINKIAKETGLQFRDIKTALTGAISGFESMGVKMSFAQPIFEGFTRSLQKVGLGIKLAASEARAFVQSMLSMTSSYENMFLMQQRGGLNTGGGGGGMLSASIGMRARMLEAESTGDQASIGLEMASALKETLASFTGGDIVTLQEADQSPELASTFFVQEQLLSQFGISGKSAERTLELLEGLDEAKAIGDEESVKKFGELIDSEVNREDETLAETEKSNVLLKQMLAQMNYGNELSRLMISIRRNQADVAGEGLRAANKEIMEKQNEIAEAILKGSNVEELEKELSEMMKGSSEKLFESLAGDDKGKGGDLAGSQADRDQKIYEALDRVSKMETKIIITIDDDAKDLVKVKEAVSSFTEETNR